ncbi:MAG: tetratricopeptide repeat protein [Acidimicrobiales bacterium]
MYEVTDATFAAQVIARSSTVPVVVDLWAEWCAPCKTLGPIIEKVIGETSGAVDLAKVDVDTNPVVAQAFKVQSIPSVFAFKDGVIVDSFVGAQPESVVRAFIERLAPGASIVDGLIAAGDESSLRQALQIDPENVGAALALADYLLSVGRLDEVEATLANFVPTPEVKTVLARVALQRRGENLDENLDATLESLLASSTTNDESKTRLLELLDALGPGDPRYVTYRRRLASRLY